MNTFKVNTLTSTIELTLSQLGEVDKFFRENFYVTAYDDTDSSMTTRVRISRRQWQKWRSDSGVIYQMDQLTPQEVAEVSGFLSCYADLEKYDNTANPDSPFRMMCIWRTEYENWLTKEKEMSVRPKPMQVTPPTGAPDCPDHREQMRYDPATGKFVCPVKDCQIKASPKTSKANLEGTVLTGEMELVKKGDQYFIHLPEQNVMIDVNPILEHLSTGEKHGSDGVWHLGLNFPGVRDLTDTEDGD
jgi:hypothetical protein